MNQAKEKDRTKTYLKAISLILTLLLWFYVVNEGADYQIGQEVIDVKLEYKNVAEGLQVDGPNQVKVELWGIIQEAGQITASVDLAQKGPGTYNVPVDLKSVTGVLFTRVNPRTVNIKLEEIQENTVPVNYKVILNPPEGYELMDIVTEPERCLIRGDQDLVNQVSSAVCQVDLSNVKSMSTLELQLTAVDKGNNKVAGVRIVPNTVKVFAIVEQTKAIKEVPVKAVVDGQAAEGYRVNNIMLSDEIVKIIGPSSMINNINELNTKPINLNNSDQSFTATIELDIPEGITVYPREIQANLEIGKTTENGDSQ